MSEQTTVSHDDLARLGEKVLNWVAMEAVLGHGSLAGGLDYIKPDGSWELDFTLDFIRACRYRRDDEAMKRLLAFVTESGWTRHCMNRVGEVLTP